MSNDRTPKSDPPHSDRDAPVQPIPERPHPSGDPKSDNYAPVDVEPKPEGGKTKYDKPTDGADDFAIDEQRDKRIRGNEAPKDVADPPKP
ncbi:hypothetical protein [Jannaschia donghaensis]|uniref:Uncharacterized protein n=1 Tax=Jannaschia donghaensis TaxID=420998 RepID=A0A0M6YP63_9RHOB|nr:hypothetical protein [Jannaschia donghaensis]CTQ50806.1 hypothetical protein JDO7802_02835 [Jannaschia donghaensis]